MCLLLGLWADFRLGGWRLGVQLNSKLREGLLRNARTSC